jgi:hypothetical protein
VAVLLCLWVTALDAGCVARIIDRYLSRCVAELVNQHAYGWLEVVAAPVLVDVV